MKNHNVLSILILLLIISIVTQKAGNCQNIKLLVDTYQAGLDTSFPSVHVQVLLYGENLLLTKIDNPLDTNLSNTFSITGISPAIYKAYFTRSYLSIFPNSTTIPSFTKRTHAQNIADEVFLQIITTIYTNNDNAPLAGYLRTKDTIWAYPKTYLAKIKRAYNELVDCERNKYNMNCKGCNIGNLKLVLNFMSSIGGISLEDSNIFTKTMNRTFINKLTPYDYNNKYIISSICSSFNIKPKANYIDTIVQLRKIRDSLINKNIGLNGRKFKKLVITNLKIKRIEFLEYLLENQEAEIRTFMNSLSFLKNEKKKHQIELIKLQNKQRSLLSSYLDTVITKISKKTKLKANSNDSTIIYDKNIVLIANKLRNNIKSNDINYFQDSIQLKLNPLIEKVYNYSKKQNKLKQDSIIGLITKANIKKYLIQDSILMAKFIINNTKAELFKIKNDTNKILNSKKEKYQKEIEQNTQTINKLYSRLRIISNDTNKLISQRNNYLNELEININPFYKYFLDSSFKKNNFYSTLKSNYFKTDSQITDLNKLSLKLINTLKVTKFLQVANMTDLPRYYFIDSVQLEFYQGTLRKIISIGSLYEYLDENGDNIPEKDTINQFIVYKNERPIPFSTLVHFYHDNIKRAIIDPPGNSAKKAELFRFKDLRRGVFNKIKLYNMHDRTYPYTIYLNGVIRYLPLLEVRSDVYNPADSVYVIKFEKNRRDELTKLVRESTQNIFEAKIFSDALGLLFQNNPNGIIQTEISKKVIINPTHNMWNGANFFEPSFSISRIGSKALPLQVGSGLSHHRTDSVSTINSYQYSNLKLGFKFNIINYQHPAFPFSLYANAGVYIYQIDFNKDTNSSNNNIISKLAYSLPEIESGIKFSPDKRFGFDVTYKLIPFVISSIGNDFRQDDPVGSGNRHPYVLHSFYLSGFLFANTIGKIFFRGGATFSSDFKNDFIQLQFGYSFNVFKLISKN